jgi:hypothetical protein
LNTPTIIAPRADPGIEPRLPKIEAGSIGANARSQGAASEIIRAQCFLKAITSI